jgi:hypothetical protein
VEAEGVAHQRAVVEQVGGVTVGVGVGATVCVGVGVASTPTTSDGTQSSTIVFTVSSSDPKRLVVAASRGQGATWRGETRESLAR